jgi:hypothetical protein
MSPPPAVMFPPPPAVMFPCADTAVRVLPVMTTPTAMARTIPITILFGHHMPLGNIIYKRELGKAGASETSI